MTEEQFRQLQAARQLLANPLKGQLSAVERLGLAELAEDFGTYIPPELIDGIRTAVKKKLTAEYKRAQAIMDKAKL